MSTRDIIDAIESGDSLAVQQSFETEISSRIADRLDAMKVDVARNMFSSEAASVEAPTETSTEISTDTPEGE